MRPDWTGRTRALWELWTQQSGMNISPVVLRWLESLSINRVGTEESYEKLECMVVKQAMNVKVLEKWKSMSIWGGIMVILIWVGVFGGDRGRLEEAGYLVGLRGQMRS